MGSFSYRSGGWHLPDTEETKNVIDTVGVEVLLHGTKPGTPPPKAVLLHLIPVVGRESPVLAVGGVIVWRRTSLLVHVEELWLKPRFSFEV